MLPAPTSVRTGKSNESQSVRLLRVSCSVDGKYTQCRVYLYNCNYCTVDRLIS